MRHDLGGRVYYWPTMKAFRALGRKPPDLAIYKPGGALYEEDEDDA